LILTRRIGESLVIGGNVVLTIVKLKAHGKLTGMRLARGVSRPDQ